MWGGGSGSGSYANDWGGRYDNYQVLINGQTFSVTQNLRNALKFLGRRTAGRDRRFWTDAICINQTDVNEKSSQIRMMPHIYSAPRRFWSGWGALVLKPNYGTSNSLASCRSTRKFLSELGESSTVELTDYLPPGDQRPSSW